MRIETATIERLRDALLKSGRREGNVSTSAYETLTRQGLLSPEETAALERVDPMAEAMFLMMSADDRIETAERDALRGAIRGLTDDLLHAGTIDVMLDNYSKALAEEGRDARLKDIAKTLSADRDNAEGAFALAAAVALADGEVAESEREFIAQLAEWFGISAARADAILDQLEDDRGN